MPDMIKTHICEPESAVDIVEGPNHRIRYIEKVHYRSEAGASAPESY